MLDAYKQMRNHKIELNVIGLGASRPRGAGVACSLYGFLDNLIGLGTVVLGARGVKD